MLTLTLTINFRLEDCLQLLIDTNRLPEAAFFARTYLPSQISRVVKLWRDELRKTNEKAAQALADPTEYENLFAGYQDSLKTEQYLEQERKRFFRASEYPNVPQNHLRKPVEEMQTAEENNEFVYREPEPKNQKDENEFESANSNNDDEDDYGEDKKLENENSISNLAKKIQETKLNNQPANAAETVSARANPSTNTNLNKDDIDLELDIDLENVDTTDVNLDDDLSD